VTASSVNCSFCGFLVTTRIYFSTEYKIIPIRFSEFSSDDMKFIDEVASVEVGSPRNASKRFQQRNERLAEACSKGEKSGEWSESDRQHYLKTWERNDNFLVVPEKKFLICVLPKCSSTSWHWIVRDMREPLSVGHEFGWQDRQKNTEIAQQLEASVGLQLLNDQSAVRAIAVRHPFGKLISGWNQKLARDTTYSSFLMEAYPLMKRFASSKDKHHVLTFEDFMDYLAAYGNNKDNLDYHFLPMKHLCKPCLYPYNLVIKQEALGVDEKWLASVLNVTHLPWKEKGPGYKNDKPSEPVEVIRTYFRNVKPSTINALKQLYYYDFAIFGYSFDTKTLTAGGLR